MDNKAQRDNQEKLLEIKCLCQGLSANYANKWISWSSWSLHSRVLLRPFSHRPVCAEMRAAHMPSWNCFIFSHGGMHVYKFVSLLLNYERGIHYA